MKRPSVHDVVYNRQFPKPKKGDPPSFYYHMTTNLVPEVRYEVQNFYGDLNSLEAQYPGLDYTFEPHRKRLSRFPWHRRLFRIFDELNLTDEEILSICQWEGTKSAKDKYEAETGRRILNTTADDIVIIQPSLPRAFVYFQTDILDTAESYASCDLETQNFQQTTPRAGGEHSDEDDISSVGVQLRDQLLAVAAGHAPDDVPLIAEWLKYMTEREGDPDTMLQAIRAGLPPPTMSGRVGSRMPIYGTHDDDEEMNTINRLTSMQSMTTTTTASSHGCPPTQEESLAMLNGSVQA